MIFQSTPDVVIVDENIEDHDKCADKVVVLILFVLFSISEFVIGHCSNFRGI